MRIDPAAAREIEAAFAAAQSRTSAPLFCVVAETSADYALGPSLTASALALIAPWPLIAFTTLPAARIFLIQLVLFALLLAVLAFAPVRVALASRVRRRSACYRASVVQFARFGLAHAPQRDGALLYVSLTERYARIVSEAAIPQEAWRGVIADLGAGLRKGETAAAFKSAASRMGDLLAPQFPAVPGAEKPKVRRFHML